MTHERNFAAEPVANLHRREFCADQQQRKRKTDWSKNQAVFGMLAIGIESDDVVNYCFPKAWPADREQRAPIIGWLQTEARYLP